MEAKEYKRKIQEAYELAKSYSDSKNEKDLKGFLFVVNHDLKNSNEIAKPITNKGLTGIWLSFSLCYPIIHKLSLNLVPNAVESMSTFNLLIISVCIATFMVLYICFLENKYRKQEKFILKLYSESMGNSQHLTNSEQKKQEILKTVVMMLGALSWVCLLLFLFLSLSPIDENYYTRQSVENSTMLTFLLIGLCGGGLTLLLSTYIKKPVVTD